MTPGDWPRVWPFFDAIVRAGETYAYPTDLTSGQAQPLWTTPPPGQTVVLCEGEGEGERVLGSATMGPNRPGRGSHVGTGSFMVAPEARGGGVGRALGEYVVDWHRRGAITASSSTRSSRPTWPPYACGTRSGSRPSAPCPAPSTRASTVAWGCT